MKIVISVLCWILVAFCAYFPYAYFNKDMDQKEIRVSHILVNTEEEAKNIQEQLKEKSFEELAEKYSLCDTKKDKGDLGYQTRKRLVPEFANVAFKLKENEVSAPVQTKSGWHLIKVYEVNYYSEKENFAKKVFKLN